MARAVAAVHSPRKAAAEKINRYTISVREAPRRLSANVARRMMCSDLREARDRSRTSLARSASGAVDGRSRTSLQKQLSRRSVRAEHMPPAALGPGSPPRAPRATPVAARGARARPPRRRPVADARRSLLARRRQVRRPVFLGGSGGAAPKAPPHPSGLVLVALAAALAPRTHVRVHGRRAGRRVCHGGHGGIEDAIQPRSAHEPCDPHGTLLPRPPRRHTRIGLLGARGARGARGRHPVRRLTRPSASVLLSDRSDGRSFSAACMCSGCSRPTPSRARRSPRSSRRSTTESHASDELGHASRRRTATSCLYPPRRRAATSCLYLHPTLPGRSALPVRVS